MPKNELFGKCFSKHWTHLSPNWSPIPGFWYSWVFSLISKPQISKPLFRWKTSFFQTVECLTKYVSQNRYLAASKLCPIRLEGFHDCMGEQWTCSLSTRMSYLEFSVGKHQFCWRGLGAIISAMFEQLFQPIRDTLLLMPEAGVKLLNLCFSRWTKMWSPNVGSSALNSILLQCQWIQNFQTWNLELSCNSSTTYWPTEKGVEQHWL